MPTRLTAATILAAPLAVVAVAPAHAQPASVNTESSDFFNAFWHRQTMLGDAGGIRTVLGNAGISLNLTDTEEVLGNVSGGVKRGATYDALTTLTLQLDTLKAFGWAGGTFNVSGLQIRGRNLSEYYLQNLQTVSGIEAEPTTRLWEAWYQQSFLDGRADVKLGQQSIDQEFMSSTGSALFLNTMMGWPMIPSADLYAGGPAYPLSSLGIRLRTQPSGSVTLLGGVFQDNPPGGPFDDDDQLRGSTRWGGNANLRTGALVIGEVQYTLNQSAAAGEMVRPGEQPSGLPGTYKLGFWYDTAAFPSPRLDNAGLSLADPNSSGTARTLRNNFSINAGLTLKAPFHGRDNDTAGIGFGVATVGNAAAGLDRDTAFFAGSPSPVRSSETFVELTYQAQLTPWLQVQPDAQYIFNPGGGVADPNQPARRLRNEAVLGIRSNITF